MPAPVVCLSGQYVRRTPESTVLHTALVRGVPEFLAAAEARGRQVPRFVERELRRYLDCGQLEKGFARVRCAECGFDRLVAFSCKGRGFCPSCCGRRMADMASRWVDELLPDVSYRQWVLSVPPPLRYLLAYDSELVSVVVRAFVGSLFGYLRREAVARYGLRSQRDAHPGALVVVQRFGSALNLNVHLHTLGTDGVFVEEGEGVRFLKLGAPTDGELRAVAWAACTKTIRYLRAQGRWFDLGEDSGTPGDEDRLALEEPLLAELYGASIVGRLALGPRGGQRVMRLVANPPRHDEPRPIAVSGFDVHASVSVESGEPKKLERLCRYLFRPPAGVGRFEGRADGSVSVRLKRAWSDGTTHVLLTPLELAEKLAALVPPPRVNQVRYYGVFAPRSKLRSRVVPVSPEPSADPEAPDPDADGESRCRHRQPWAMLMKRVFEIDVLECPRCKSRMQRIAFITQADVIARILDSIGHAADSPAVA